VSGGERHTELLGKPSHCAGEGDPLHLAHEADQIAVCATGKAVIVGAITATRLIEV
jgi:hypothetical protein